MPTLVGGSGSRTPLAVPVILRVLKANVLESLDVVITASYRAGNDGNDPRTAVANAVLPLCIGCSIRSPVKNPGLKCTLDTNRAWCS